MQPCAQVITRQCGETKTIFNHSRWCEGKWEVPASMSHFLTKQAPLMVKVDTINCRAGRELWGSWGKCKRVPLTRQASSSKKGKMKWRLMRLSQAITGPGWKAIPTPVNQGGSKNRGLFQDAGLLSYEVQIIFTGLWSLYSFSHGVLRRETGKLPSIHGTALCSVLFFSTAVNQMSLFVSQPLRYGNHFCWWVSRVTRLVNNECNIPACYILSPIEAKKDIMICPWDHDKRRYKKNAVN